MRPTYEERQKLKELSLKMFGTTSGWTKFQKIPLTETADKNEELWQKIEKTAKLAKKPIYSVKHHYLTPAEIINEMEAQIVKLEEATKKFNESLKRKIEEQKAKEDEQANEL